MNESQISTCRHHGWLDTFAISMSVICAIHCLVTPLLLVSLPILATSFWVHEDFHLWMVGFVIPTTSFAVFTGCRKHKDKLVLLLSIAGVVLLFAVAIYESFFHNLAGAGDPSLNVTYEDFFGTSAQITEQAHCENCATVEKSGIFASGPVLINLIGGIFLAGAHCRNFILCRKADCNHSHK